MTHARSVCTCRAPRRIRVLASFPRTPLLAGVQRLAQIGAQPRGFAGGTHAAVGASMSERISLETHVLDDFAPARSEDILARCERFASFVADFTAREDAGGQYRVEIEGPLDRLVTVRDEHG